VGLPLSLAFASNDFSVLGFDIDDEKVRTLNGGLSYISHVAPERVAAAVRANKLRATADFGELASVDVVIICVPTPLTPQREPDMRFVVGTAEQIARHLHEGQLIVLESTTYPGTTEGLLRETLERSGRLTLGDYFLAFSPEREDPGNLDFNTTTIPKVVGGVDEPSGRLAQLLYDQVIAKTILVSSARTAEATKLTENIFRAVNIALVNELKMIYDRMSVDVWEVLDAAATKPFGFMRFNPGPGWGGHCIPLDPFYLSWKAREYGMSTKFIELAGEINVDMPQFVVGKLQAALNERGRPVKGAEVLVLGLAYKKDVGDARESPAFEIIDHLLRLGAVVSYHDPFVPVAPKVRTWPHLPPMTSRPLTPELLRSCSAVMLVTDHSTVDYGLVRTHAPLIVDTRGVFRERLDKVVQA
jgi:UDP-N-acetyl-D-glucosamine dehydrogenase